VSATAVPHARMHQGNPDAGIRLPLTASETGMDVEEALDHGRFHRREDAPAFHCAMLAVLTTEVERLRHENADLRQKVRAVIQTVARSLE
jgi:hypothetical protein